MSPFNFQICWSKTTSLLHCDHPKWMNSPQYSCATEFKQQGFPCRDPQLDSLLYCKKTDDTSTKGLLSGKSYYLSQIKIYQIFMNPQTLLVLPLEHCPGCNVFQQMSSCPVDFSTFLRSWHMPSCAWYINAPTPSSRSISRPHMETDRWGRNPATQNSTLLV